MIIKSHIRGGFRDAASYLKEQGENEETRVVNISDPQASNLDEAFRAMWAVSYGSRAKKPLHHVSINPMKHERLTDAQLLKICERLEQNYGYQPGEHQRVIVEHVKDGRQHFHVMWNRVSLRTGKAHYPKLHKNASKLTARQMEVELGFLRLRSPKANNVRPPRTKTAFTRMPQLTNLMLKRIGHHIIHNRPAPERHDLPIPTRAKAGPAMSEAQRIDLKAAMEGKISWAQYFQKWGIQIGGLSI